MTVLFTALSAILLVIVLTRRLDLFSVAAVCLIVYNCYCATGYVWIASHEKAGVNYYQGTVDTRVFLIIICQMLLMILVILWHDRKGQNSASVLDADRRGKGKYSRFQIDKIFFLTGVISLVIMLSNVMSIGLKGLSASKSEVWAQTNVLYVTGLWLAMAVFAYAMKTKQKKYLWLSLPQILVHLFIGSRAYFAVIVIVALVCWASDKPFTLKRNTLIIVVAFFGMMGIMLYKQIYEEVKAGDIAAIASILQDPDTYNWILRWGEPRIVLANFNYVVTSGLTLSTEEIVGRIISVIPFLNNFTSISERNLLLSTVVIGDLNSSYGLASNIWGEFYVIGSYPLVALMYCFWLWLVAMGNRMITNSAWTASFILPLVSYFAYYIHRMDLVKVLGNVKMDLFAMIIWWAVACVVVGYIAFGRPGSRYRIKRRRKASTCGLYTEKHRFF